MMVAFTTHSSPAIETVTPHYPLTLDGNFYGPIYTSSEPVIAMGCAT